ncbi:MAG: Stp1/IreP family PP2C-type Ser/Thr phosphatase [Frankiales bacterium]|nr:Stp1/IreP family PP2C-type Ser/Thr phosphatase [Frankiales bacterium]
MSLTLRYGARSDVGLLRAGNEDAMYAGPRLLAVADGMGGHAAGEVASRIVIETVAALDAQPPDGNLTDALRDAVHTANTYLRDMVAADGALEGMGTTLTALLWVGEQLGLVHVGDSRGYLYRDGQLQPITHDHTLVQNLIDEGRITPEEATTHPQRSWITRALDGREALDLDLSMRDVQPGDRYLLCSDGLSSYVSEQTIAETLAEADPQVVCDRLVDLALRAGGPDNVTCIVADLVEDAGSTETPILGGAAAESTADHTGPVADTPASRAADLVNDGGAVAEPGGGDDPATATAIAAVPAVAAAAPAKPRRVDRDEPAPRPAGGGRSRALIAVLVGVVLLAALAVLGTYLYIRTQYYVGAAPGTPRTVAVYRGVTGSVLGIDLSSVDVRSNLPVNAVPIDDRRKVLDGLQASSKRDAQQIVQRLRTEACAAIRAKSSTQHRTGRSAPPPAPTPSYCSTTP